jgi:hypothetical protein
MDGGDGGDSDGGDTRDGCAPTDCSAFGNEFLNAACECEPCHDNGDCEGALVCAPGTGCVACTDSDSSKCDLSTPVCLTGGNTCVQCNEAVDCGDPLKPICDDHECRACTTDNDCAGDGKVCREDTGECVACEPNKEDPAQENCDNGNACDPTAFTCTGAPRGTLNGCAKCVSDNECLAGARCVPTSFEGLPYGTYCLEQKDSGACPNRFAAKRTATSTLGHEASYCFPDDQFATCEAISNFQNLCEEDGECGAEGVDDGLCKDNRCTYGCDSESDCSGPMSPPAPPNCIGVGGAQYCNPN